MEALIHQGRPAPAVFSGSKKPERGVHLLDIEGCQVEFPFAPYDCQRDYMASVIRALKQGKNALLESPTGTGKTLCLLCATLAWRESLRGQGGLPVAAELPVITAAASAASLVSGTGAGPMSLVEQELGIAPDPALSHLPPGLQLVLQARAASQAAQGAQGAAGGSSSSRSGPGGPAGSKLPTIVYSSRTHSQLAQVIKELQRSSYRDRVRSTILSSRQQSCLHPKVSKMTGGQANQACKALVSQKRCAWYNNFKYGSRNKAWQSELEQVPDMEDLMSFGRQRTMCAFYLGKDGAKDADVVFMPYNYLLDHNVRKNLLDQVSWDNAVVIFDEAHNVEGVCADSGSFDITAKHLTDAMAEARRVKEVCAEAQMQGSVHDPGQEPGAPGNINYRELGNDLGMLLGVLKCMENNLHALSQGMSKDGMTRPGAFMFEFLSKMNITDVTVPVINTTIDRAAEAIQVWELERGATASKNATPALQHLQDCLNLAFETLSPMSSKPGAHQMHKGYRVHVHMERSWGNDKMPTPTLSYWCFIPGLAMMRLGALRLRSILLTSGTLAPLDSFASELQLPFEVQLENPHIVQASQVWVGVLPVGPSGHQLCSTYKERDNRDYKDDLGAAVVNMSRLVPDGLLVFFPSYSVLNTCIDHWKTTSTGGSSVWERIIQHKAPVIEPRDSQLFPQAIEDFKQKLDAPTTNGAVFFAVCRGKVSEGLDFSDRAGRGVIITGIPFAVATDPKVRLKREVLDEERRSNSRGSGGCAVTLSGEAWYLQQAMRAVNQAIGRVIRHRWDYGAVVLADKRFGDASIQRALSRWLQSYVAVHQNFGSAAASLTRFFKEKADLKGPAAGGGAAAGSAFQVVGGSAAAAGGTHKAGGSSSSTGHAGGRSRGNLLELVPAAQEVSGLCAGSMLAGVAKNNRERASRADSKRTGSEVGGGEGAAKAQYRQGSLLHMLQNQPDQDENSAPELDVQDDAQVQQPTELDFEANVPGLDRKASTVQAAAAVPTGTHNMGMTRLEALLLSSAAGGSQGEPAEGAQQGAAGHTQLGAAPAARPMQHTRLERPAQGMAATASLPPRPKAGTGGVAGQSYGVSIRGRAAVSVEYDPPSPRSGHDCGNPAQCCSDGACDAGPDLQAELAHMLSEPVACAAGDEQAGHVDMQLSVRHNNSQPGDEGSQGQGGGGGEGRDSNGGITVGPAARILRLSQQQQQQQNHAQQQQGRGDHQQQSGSQQPESLAQDNVTAPADLSKAAGAVQSTRGDVCGDDAAGGAAGHIRPHASSGKSGGAAPSVPSSRQQPALLEPCTGTSADALSNGAGKSFSSDAGVATASHLKTAGAGEAGGAAGASTAARASKPSPKDFMSGLRAKLSPELFQQVQQLLLQYKSGNNVQRLVDGLIAALKGPKTVHLLEGFISFLPKEHRTWVSEVVKTHIQRYACQQGPKQANSGTSSGAVGNGSTHGAVSSKPAGDVKRLAQQTLFGTAASAAGPSKAAVRGQSAAQRAPPAQQCKQPVYANPLTAYAGKPSVGPSQAAGVTAAPQATSTGSGGRAASTAASGASTNLQPAGSGVSRPASAVGSSRAAAGVGPVAGQQGSVRPAAGLSIGAQKREGPAPAATNAPVAAAKKARTGPPGESCCMCGACPMDIAYAAPCGHSGCRQCWHAQIARHFKCPKCSREVRQKNLTRKFFA